MEENYLPRLVDKLINDLFEHFPALLIEGPRATGKTTTAARHAQTIVRLDSPTEATVFQADPDTALAGLPEPILLDEWQAVPSVLGAVKRSVDTGRRPARFIVTGSARGRLDQPTWPGTGRLLTVNMFGLTVRELMCADLGRPPFLELVAAEGAAGLRVPPDPPNLRGYLELAVNGGFPDPVVQLPAAMRKSWLESYVERLLTRDVEQLDGGRDPERLKRYFTAYALNSAGLAAEKTLYEAAGVSKKTAQAYEQLLRNLFIVDAMPAWSSNRLKRLTRSPKRYFVDSGLLAAVLGVGVDGLMRNGDLLGRILDTFVVAQLRAELTLISGWTQLYHLRQEHGVHEVDVVAELDVNRLVGIEIKATAAPGRDDAKHLRWLRDELGEKFVVGVVFHTGKRIFMLDEHIIAAPICTLWG